MSQETTSPVQAKVAEVCKWSVGEPHQYRYLDVSITDKGGEVEYLRLQVPESLAKNIADALNNVKHD